MSGARPLTINDTVEKIGIADIGWFHAQLPPKTSPVPGHQAATSNAWCMAANYLFCLNASNDGTVMRDGNFNEKDTCTLFLLYLLHICCRKSVFDVLAFVSTVLRHFDVLFHNSSLARVCQKEERFARELFEIVQLLQFWTRYVC